MYKILGADQKEYGPVSADQLRQWITEGRANAQTLVLAEGGAQWRALGTLLEFFPSPGVSHAPAGQPTSGSQPRTNGLALTSLIMGLLAVTVGLCCCCGIPFNVLGIVFALVALGQISANPQTQTGKGLAITGLILSLLSLLLSAGWMFLNLSNGGGMEKILRDLNKF